VVLDKILNCTGGVVVVVCALLQHEGDGQYFTSVSAVVCGVGGGLHLFCAAAGCL
jgi:hypothetical protein